MALLTRKLFLRLSSLLLIPFALSAWWLRQTRHLFNVEEVLAEAIRVTSRSWEYGTLSEALLELKSPDLAVFSNDRISL